MASYWLVPATYHDDRFIMSEQRIALVPHEAAEQFLQLARMEHSKMLIPFKANLLLSEDSEMACGVEEAPFDLHSGEPIRFGDGEEELELSHCAHAYLDKLPTQADMKRMLRNLDSLTEPQQTADEPIAGWLHKMKAWNEQGFVIMLLS